MICESVKGFGSWDHNSGASRQRETDREREIRKEIWVEIVK